MKKVRKLSKFGYNLFIRQEEQLDELKIVIVVTAQSYSIVKRNIRKHSEKTEKRVASSFRCWLLKILKKSGELLRPCMLSLSLALDELNVGTHVSHF